MESNIAIRNSCYSPIQLIPPAAAELRQLRESAGMSQAHLGDRTGYDRKTINRWERGDQPPREAVIEYLRGLPGNSPKLIRETLPAFKFVDLFAGLGGFHLARHHRLEVDV